jgi:tetratricopeptide (TPR) repeat protein
MISLNKKFNLNTLLTAFIMLAFCNSLQAAPQLSDAETGANYQRDGNTHKARYYYLRALSQNNKDADALYGLASMEYRNGEYDKAFPRLNKILSGQSTNIDALILRGNIYLKRASGQRPGNSQANLNKALKDFQAAEQLDSDNPKVQAGLESTYTQMGDKQNSGKAMKRYMQLTKTQTTAKRKSP